MIDPAVPQPVTHFVIDDRASLHESLDHFPPLQGVEPVSQLQRGAPQNLFEVQVLRLEEGRVRIQKRPFLQRCDADANGA